MIQEYKEIEQLIERFFEGQTSGAEERELYRFFARENIPEHLRCYLPVFDYFENKLPEELEAEDLKMNGLKTELRKKHLKSHKKRRNAWIAVAASVALMLGITAAYNIAGESDDPFEGSYIVRNGVRITDLKIIRPEIEKTLALAARLQDEHEQRIRQIEIQIETQENFVKSEIEKTLELAARQQAEHERRMQQIETQINIAAKIVKKHEIEINC